MEELVCTRCLNVWPATSVYFAVKGRSTRYPNGHLTPRCRACENEVSKARYHLTK